MTMNTQRKTLLGVCIESMTAVRKIYDMDNPKKMNEAIDIFESWIKKQHHFTKKDFNRDYLERIIISCKGSIEKAKRQLDRMCTFRTLLPKFFDIREDKEDYEEILKIMSLIPLPKFTNNYNRVCLGKVQVDFTPEVFMTFCRYTILICEYLRRNDYANGYIIAIDLRDINLIELVTKVSITDIQHILSIVIEGYGARVQGLHIISNSKLGEVLIKILRQCVSNKISSRLHVHSNIDKFTEIIDKSILPKDFGGTERSLMELNEDWINVLCSEENAAYVQMISKARTNETKRLKDEFNNLYIGAPGTFKNIIVD